jgi:SAM-dependent methyltransferase
MPSHAAMSTAGLGKLGISEELRRFTREMHYERMPILEFVMAVAADTQSDVTVLDLGAGDAPYRELFAHTNYVTSDWEKSPHMGGANADIVAPITDLPVEDASVDLVLCTQVLEHVSDPEAALVECLRVLKSRGRIAITVPFVWQLHELPFDYFRYTHTALDHLLERAGFTDIEIHRRNDSFTTLAQLMLNVGATMGRAADGLDKRREQVEALMYDLAGQIARFAPLDIARVLPLGYTALARRP